VLSLVLPLGRAERYPSGMKTDLSYVN